MPPWGEPGPQHGREGQDAALRETNEQAPGALRFTIILIMARFVTGM